jgi:hypothetical protein
MWVREESTSNNNPSYNWGQWDDPRIINKQKSKIMAKQLVLKREVKKLPGKFAFYADGKVPATDQKDGYKGKSYFRFAYDESVFIVHEDDDFIQAWADNKVHQVKIDVTSEGATFLNFTTREDLLDEARFEATLESIKLSASAVKVVSNPEELV